MSPQPTGRPRVRRQTERSKSGCATCKTRRVKCDETKPCCNNCRRLSFHCDWSRPPSAKEKKDRSRRNAENKQPVPIRSSADGAISSTGNGQDILSPEPRVEQDQDVEVLAAHDGQDETTLLFPSSEDSLLTQIGLNFTLSSHDVLGFDNITTWLCPLPTTFGLVASFSSLPTLAALTTEDQQALNFFNNGGSCAILFGFGSKSISWSTHQLLGKVAASSSTLFHLLLAAASGEYAWQYYENNGQDMPHISMLDNADRNFKIGHDLLTRAILDPSSEPLEIMSSLWFLYIYQRRRPSKSLRMAYASLSFLMADYLGRSRLPHILASGDDDDISSGQSASGPRYFTPKKKALLARLTTWLFWVDTQAGFQKEGGLMARLLSQSVSAKSIITIFDVSTRALLLNWDNYPDHEVVDDMLNKSSLKLIHHAWVLVQEINDAVAGDDVLPHRSLDPVRSHEIKAKIDALRRKPSVSPVFALTGSKARVRDRLLANSDWAVANFYALCIYHFRCSCRVEGGDGDDSSSLTSSPQEEDISPSVDPLLVLIQKTLATADKGQTDRMQWPLFWAGLEAPSQFAQDWVLERLRVNRGLHDALKQIILLEQQQQQEGGGEGGAWERKRVGMGRIREVCEMACSDDNPGSDIVMDAGSSSRVVGMGLWGEVV